MGAEAADLAMAHLAGREAGHNAVLKTEGGVDVIDRTVRRTTPGGSKPNHRSLGQFQHQIEVMDHQIKNHGDVIGAVGMGAVSAPFEHHHLLIRHHLDQLTESGVEALDMSDLQEAACPLGGRDQLRRLVLTGGDRLFNQHMLSRLQTGEAHGMVQQGRHRNADGLHLLEHGPVIGEPTAAELLNRQLAAIGIRIGHPDEVGVAQQAEHPRMVPTHVADPDHTDLDGHHGVGGHRRAMAVGPIIGDQSVFSAAGGRIKRTRSMRGPAMTLISNCKPWKRSTSPGEGMCCKRSSRKPARVW